MSSSKPPSLSNNTFGEPAINAGLTMLAAALGGGPLVALLPVLGNSLASKRHQEEIEKVLIYINDKFQQQEEKIKNLTDEQYKLVNETVLALLQAPSPRKINYLKRAIENSLSIEEVQPQEAVALSRIVRDISAEEADFLIKNFKFDRIQVTSNKPEHEKKVLFVHPDSQECLVVTGLVSLGLLGFGEPTWGDGDLLRYSAIVKKLLVLFNKPIETGS